MDGDANLQKGILGEIVRHFCSPQKIIVLAQKMQYCPIRRFGFVSFGNDATVLHNKWGDGTALVLVLLQIAVPGNNVLAGGLMQSLKTCVFLATDT